MAGDSLRDLAEAKSPSIGRAALLLDDIVDFDPVAGSRYTRHPLWPTACEATHEGDAMSPILGFLLVCMEHLCLMVASCRSPSSRDYKGREHGNKLNGRDSLGSTSRVSYIQSYENQLY